MRFPWRFTQRCALSASSNVVLRGLRPASWTPSTPARVLSFTLINWLDSLMELKGRLEPVDEPDLLPG